MAKVVTIVVGRNLTELLITLQRREHPCFTAEEMESQEGQCFDEETEPLRDRAWTGTESWSELILHRPAVPRPIT